MSLLKTEMAIHSKHLWKPYLTKKTFIYSDPLYQTQYVQNE